MKRQPNSEPKAEDNYKSRTMNVTPGTADEQRTKSRFYSVSQRRSKPNVSTKPTVVKQALFH